jgi:hypothetical protein
MLRFGNDLRSKVSSPLKQSKRASAFILARKRWFHSSYANLDPTRENRLSNENEH